MPLYVKVGRAVRLLGWTALVFSAIVWFALFTLNFRKGPPQNYLPPILVSASMTTALSVLFIWVGSALMKKKIWSRYAGIVIGALMLLGFPVGTLLGLYVLWGLVKGWDEATTP